MSWGERDESARETETKDPNWPIGIFIPIYTAKKFTPPIVERFDEDQFSMFTFFIFSQLEKARIRHCVCAMLFKRHKHDVSF